MSTKAVHKFAPGDLVEDHELVTILGESVHVPDPERKVHLQFRAEAFNVFNHSQFFGPSAVSGDISSPLFGQVVQAAAPRLLQLAGKLTF